MRPRGTAAVAASDATMTEAEVDELVEETRRVLEDVGDLTEGEVASILDLEDAAVINGARVGAMGPLGVVAEAWVGLGTLAPEAPGKRQHSFVQTSSTVLPPNAATRSMLTWRLGT